MTTKKKAQAKKPSSEAPPAKETPAIIAQLGDDERNSLVAMATEIIALGFVPHDVLRKKFGDRVHTVFSAIAYRQYRVVREVRRPWEDGEAVLGYELADRRFSQAEMKKIPTELGWVIEMGASKKSRYEDYRFASIRCRLTNHMLAALPVPDSDKVRVFERVNGHILIPAYCVRAALRKTLPLCGRTMILGDYIRSEAVRIPVKGTKVEKILLDSKGVDINKKLMPVVDERTRQGKGVTEHEALAPDTEYEIKVMYPSSEIKLEDLTEVLQIMGRFVRLSPARSSGYGDFEVVSVNGESLSAAA